MPDGKPQKDALHSEDMLAHVAMLYYREGLTQGEIARRTGVSRATIVNYLRAAREAGIVEIRIRGASFTASSLARELAERYGLVDVYVAHDDLAPVGPRDATDRVARVAASAMYDLLEPGDRLGVDWGNTVQRIASVFPAGQVPDLTVHQIVGSMHTRQLIAAEACAIEIARRTGAGCRTLHVPAVVSSRDLAAELRAEPAIAEQLGEFAQLTKTIFSVGALTPDSTIVAAGIATQDEVARYRDRGAVAVILCHFIDAAGQPIPCGLSARTLGITPTALLQVPVRMLVAAGAAKREAVAALLAGGYVTHLVIDEPSAKWLARQPPRGA